RSKRDWSSDVCSSDLSISEVTCTISDGRSQRRCSEETSMRGPEVYFCSTLVLTASEDTPSCRTRVRRCSRQLSFRLVLGSPVLTGEPRTDRKSTRLNSSHVSISYAV